MDPSFKSRLHQMASQFPTDYWNDSCSEQELGFAVGHGAVGATTNPNIVVNVLKKEMHLWEKRIREIIRENPTWSEVEITWKLIEEMAVNGARFLKPAFDGHKGKKGRLSIQTNPAFYRNAQAIVEQGIHFHNLAPNMQVKAPVTEAGLAAIEEMTYQGVSVNATVSFNVPQALTVGKAIEHGLDRRLAEKKPVESMAPVCTIMVGRLDDWLKALVKRDGLSVNPAILDWAGIACMKKAYALYQKRGYRARLLVAAYRHLGHWSEFVGGDVIQSMPYEWQLKINASDIEVKDHMKNPVDPAIITALYATFPDFRRAYDEKGMEPREFDDFGATVRTLRAFIAANHELIAIVRDFMLPDPELK